jgi:two-component system cell cycle sensor histidine kinase/response regulator CckA
MELSQPPMLLKGSDIPRGNPMGRTDRSGETMSRRMLILLVEDEPIVRRTVARMLEAEGFTVVDAEHGQAAHDLLATSGLNPDLVVTDLRMPYLNGAELGDAVSRLRPGVPVLYMSGFGSETSSWISPDALNNCYLAKPFSREQLIDTVKRCLQQGSSRPN